MSIAAMQKAAETLSKSNLGYDQYQRWSFFQNGKIVANKEADCSSCCGAIMKLGGYSVDLTGTWYTGNMLTKCKAAGFSVIKFSSLSQVRAGDFLINTSHHVEFAYSKTKFFSARIDENGKAHGGAAGNQTGTETGFKDAYVYSKGWNYILRPPAEPSTSSNKEQTMAYDGKMASPVVGTVSCEWRGYKNHAGIDIACKTGTPVYAAYAGTVQKTGVNIVVNRTGKGILIKNPDTEHQYYGHLSAISVTAGQSVAQGQLIGYSGATGNVTGPHLHFETWNKSGVDVNPRTHFNSHGVVPGSNTGQKATTKPVSFLPLAIDGNEGHKTVTEEERALKAAGFYKGVIEADHGLTAVRGDMLKVAEQKWLTAKKKYDRSCDGDFGVYSIKAEQSQLKDLGHYSQSIDGNTREVDGRRGAWTIKGLQAALNAGAIK